MVEKPAAGGRMIARHEGQVVLVSGTIPEERVRARVERIGKGVVYAATREVLRAAPDRRQAPPDWACGGNVYAHIAYARQLTLKGEILTDALARIGRIPLDAPPAVAPSIERGYRMRARFHVAGGRIGFFREGTHELCDPAATGQLLDETAALVGRLSEMLVTERIEDVTGLEVAENRPASERVFHFEVDDRCAVDRLTSVSRLGGVTGITCARAGARALLHGSPYVTDSLEVAAPSSRASEPVRLRRHVLAFFQGNRYLLPDLVAHVVSRAGAGPTVDLYAGVGLFAVAVAAAGKRPVTAVEGDRTSAADLQANALAAGDAVRPLFMPVEDFLRDRPPAPGTTLIVDPPRTGMSKQAMAGIVAQAADRIVYVSCDVATLARDLRKLLDAGSRLDEVRGFDLFPNTAHVEAVAVLRRR
jgi:tRNA/tmRNA/rRNA uracil-C5-methylase (TrmA/RlmC/RlmD family)